MTLALPADRPLRGIALMMGALLCFVGMDVLIKAATATQPVLQILWARFVVHLACVALALKLTGRRVPPVANKPGLQAVRSLVLAVCNLCFTAAIAFIPLAEATAINFIAPLFVLVLAGWWLNETIGWRRWATVGIGIAGVLVILRPGMGVTHPAAFLVLGTAVLFAVYAVLTRLLARHDDSLTTIFHTGLAASLVTSIAVPFVWVTPSLSGVAQLVVIGALGSLGHYLMILAYAAAPASLLAPFGYTQLVWAALFGWLVFADIPDGATIVGGLVIALGGILSVLEGRRLARSQPGDRGGKS